MSVELALLVPLLLVLHTGAFALVQTYRAEGLAQQAAESVADILARQSVPVDAPWLGDLAGLADHVARQDTALAVAEITCTRSCGSLMARQLALCWSWAGPGGHALDPAGLGALAADLPPIAAGETVVLTELTARHRIGFDLLPPERVTEIRMATQPMFVPQLGMEAARCF